jgi:hypothetical protein
MHLCKLSIAFTDYMKCFLPNRTILAYDLAVAEIFEAVNPAYAPGSDQANQLTLIEKRLNTNHFQNEYRRFCPRKTRYRQVQVPEVQILWKAHEFCGRWHYPRSGF